MSDVRGLVLDCITLIYIYKIRNTKGCWLDNFTLTEVILYRRVLEVKRIVLEGTWILRVSARF